MDYPIHYVCTFAEAKKLIEGRIEFWVTDCGCRTGHGQCTKGRIDTCLSFVEWQAPEQYHLKKVDAAFVEKLFAHAREKKLVFRPWRSETDKSITEGMCICCDCCCEYLKKDSTEVCDKGKFMQQTNFDCCTHCGACVPVCYFGARAMSDDGILTLTEANCYGCGLCESECPFGCIELVAR